MTNINSTLLYSIVRREGEYKQLLEGVRQEFLKKPLPLLVTGLCEGASDALLVSLVSDVRKKRRETVLLICPEEKECVRIADIMNNAGLRCGFYNTRDYTFYNITASHEYEHERLKVLSALISGDLDAVVTTPDASLGYTLPPERLADKMLKLEVGEQTDITDLLLRLSGCSYTRVEMVDGPGQFAVRGGIVDIYPPYMKYRRSGEDELVGGSLPMRVEFFGDEIDRLGLFDVESQRVSANVDLAEFTPAREVIATEDDLRKIKAAIASNFKRSTDERAMTEMAAETAAIDALLESGDGGCDLNFADKYITLIYPERASLLDYFPDKTMVLLRGTAAINERLKSAEWHRNQSVEDLLESGTIVSKYTDYAKPNAMLEMFLAKNVTLHVDSLASGMSGKKLGGMFNFRSRHLVPYTDNFALLCEDCRHYESTGYRTVIIAENETAARNLSSMLDEAGLRNTVLAKGADDKVFEIFKDIRFFIFWEHTCKGYELVSAKLAVLSTVSELRSGGLSSAVKQKRRKKKKSATQTIMSYADLEIGDFVVHENYGIGKYMGIENLTVDGVKRDYINIQFAGSDRLYLPTEKMDMLSKYIGAHSDDGLVKLSKFGGSEWGRTKSRAKAAVKDMAKELIALYAARAHKEGFAFPEDDDFQQDFEAAFEYDETDSQLEAIEDIKGDMMQAKPMDRLLCGDVGFGKTEVALRAAYKAVLGGKQVAILVPTTILALQHLQTATSRMRSFGVTVDMISRFRTPKQQQLSLRKLRRGETDIIIGTHRLVSKDVEFKDLGLVIIDEEQRFGVAQKEKLKQIAENVDVLTLTATPIPRTLNMAMGGIRDISVLDEAPGDRLPVQTYVLEEDELIVNEAIRRELRRGGQVFYLHNFVESIDDVAARLSAAIPEARITTAHGKMDKERLEDIWNDMLMGEIDILVCTSIIETGIDVPNANTLIVDNAHRLGLSQLHQLRGRVGRSSRRAYTYFTYPKNRALSEIAEKRLEAIREYAEFGAGFKIAMRDLELRGAGDILGAQQHGHLDAVGYELYIKLLNEAVVEEKGGKVEEKPECTVTLDFNAYIPEDYVSYPSQRMSIYKKIAMIESREDMDDIGDELSDRYGDIPPAVDNLLSIALLRANAMKCGVKLLKQNGGEIQIHLSKFDFDVWSEIETVFPGRLKMVMSSSQYLSFRMKKEENAIRIINKIFEKYIEISQKQG